MSNQQLLKELIQFVVGLTVGLAIGGVSAPVLALLLLIQLYNYAIADRTNDLFAFLNRLKASERVGFTLSQLAWASIYITATAMALAKQI